MEQCTADRVTHDVLFHSTFLSTSTLIKRSWALRKKKWEQSSVASEQKVPWRHRGWRARRRSEQWEALAAVCRSAFQLNTGRGRKKLMETAAQWPSFVRYLIFLHWRAVSETRQFCEDLQNDGFLFFLSFICRTRILSEITWTGAAVFLVKFSCNLVWNFIWVFDFIWGNKLFKPFKS